MRKSPTIFLLIVSLGLVFAGTASAQEAPTLDVAVIDENGDNVTVACPGDEVAVEVVVSANDGKIPDPAVNITFDPENGLEFYPDNAVMFYNGVKYTNDEYHFLEWREFYWDGWAWIIYAINIDPGSLQPGDVAQLIVPALVTDIGDITITAELLEVPQGAPIVIDTDSYTFRSVPCHPCHGETVPMQPTGAPVALTALGILGIMFGAVYGRLR